MTPRAFARGFIATHEGVLSMRPDDNGNWTGAARGVGRLVGSKYGTTAAAVAKHRGIPAASITRAIMAGLTVDEAVDIAVADYYKAPGLHRLPWDRVTAAVFDFAWGAGPGRAVILLQQMVGAKADGINGPATAAAYRAWRTARSEEDAARAWGRVRDGFYERIAGNEGPNDPDRAFLKGWKNRTASFLPGTPWWRAWA
jgi:lysozyme family protein